ncbi:MAG: YebC/PmpR family DNA-binding transcriptional regulator [Planctomycetota bacterium]|nr:YebC/PmpR family DNA-binding transcriptional regulator [Planctomycetota bacterium]
MAGHSHSANIARRKNAVDAKRAKIFSKCARAVMSAVKQGGPDPEANLKLRYAIEKAKAENMPKENIARAIKRASGEGAGQLEELNYEGYAPGGVALMISCLTDNRNRTAPEIKYIFEKRGGNLGSPGSVAFHFDFRSILVIETAGKEEDAILEAALEAGANDVEYDGDLATVYAAPTDFLAVKQSLEDQGFTFLSAETGYVPTNTIRIENKADASRILKLIEALEDNEDVQSVYANYDIPDDWIEELST